MRKCVSTDIEKRLSKDKFGGESKYKGRKAGGGVTNSYLIEQKKTRNKGPQTCL